MISWFKKKPVAPPPQDWKELRLQCLLNTHYLESSLRELSARIESLKQTARRENRQRLERLAKLQQKLKTQLAEERTWLQIYSKKV